MSGSHLVWPPTNETSEFALHRDCYVLLSDRICTGCRSASAFDEWQIPGLRRERAPHLCEDVDSCFQMLHPACCLMFSPSCLYSNPRALSWKYPQRDAMSSRSQASAATTMTAQSSSFTFAAIPSTSTCADAVISWNRTGGDLTFSLFLVPSSRPPTSVALVAYAIDTAVGSFDWHPVNVTPGVYQLNAIGAGFSVLSPVFVVSNGTDASCLPSPSRNSSSPFSSLTTASGPSSSHGISPGAIIGAVLGGVAFVAAMLGLCIYLRLRRGAVLGYRWRSYQHAESAGAPGRWSGLSSHVNITTQAPSMSLQDERSAGLTDARDGGTRAGGIPLTALPRLQPNRRKPSVSASSALTHMEHREPRPDPSPAPSVHARAPRASTVRLDDELPLPPTSFVAPVERLRAMPGRRPSATSAVPSSATSQMYRVRDSMWLPTPREPSSPTRLGPGGGGGGPSPSGAFLGTREGGSPRDALRGGPMWDRVP